MNQDRERAVSTVFVALASDLATGSDVVDVLSGLTASCAQLLDIASAGLLLANRRGKLQIVAASSEATRVLEMFQLQVEQGPCLDCFHSRTPVSVPNLSKETTRWPQFAAAAQNQGFASVHAVPMRLQDHALGVLGLFGTQTGPLNGQDLALAQAFADVASVALIQDRSAADSHQVTSQLQGALDSRIVIEQAKGILAHHGSLDMEQAFAALRHFSRNHNQRLTDVARTLTSRQLDPEHVLAHAPHEARQSRRPEH